MDGKRLQSLSSHIRPITRLVFSPWSDDYHRPLILVSLSEQVCFWNIRYVLNNPLDAIKPKKRSSQRFSKELKSPVEILTNGVLGLFVTNGHKNTTNNYWEDKMGPSDKPELLACIKFIGNRAQKLICNAQFDQFITIDDEGDIYVLSINDLIPTDDRAITFS